jgi:hypothetical protein
VEQKEETFLITHRQPMTDKLKTFLWQGTYEQVYKLPHTDGDVYVHVLLPEEPQTASPYGTQLLLVTQLQNTFQSEQKLHDLLWSLKRLPPEQRARELAEVQRRLETETEDLKIVLLPNDSPQKQREVALWVAENLFNLDTSSAKKSAAE